MPAVSKHNSTVKMLMTSLWCDDLARERRLHFLACDIVSFQCLGSVIGKTRKIHTFSFNGTYLDVCFDVYLGVNMNYNVMFVLAKQRQYVQAQKAMYSLIKKSQLLLPIELILQLFDHTVVPIFLYGCEVWGYENCDIIEKLHLEFCRMVLHVNKYISKCMIYGELDKPPVVIQIKQRMAHFWIS